MPVGFPMIVKPDQMSQGKGIFLTNEIEHIDLRELSVVQEYLNDPYLIDGLKFDLRLYVLVVSCDPLKIYIHKEGLVRFAT
jgi:tubulin polyglutamylase TTLL6/13